MNRSTEEGDDGDEHGDAGHGGGDTHLLRWAGDTGDGDGARRPRRALPRPPRAAGGGRRRGGDRPRPRLALQRRGRRLRVADAHAPARLPRPRAPARRAGACRPALRKARPGDGVDGDGRRRIPRAPPLPHAGGRRPRGAVAPRRCRGRCGAARRRRAQRGRRRRLPPGGGDGGGRRRLPLRPRAAAAGDHARAGGGDAAHERQPRGRSRTLRPRHRRHPRRRAAAAGSRREPADRPARRDGPRLARVPARRQRGRSPGRPRPRFGPRPARPGRCGRVGPPAPRRRAGGRPRASADGAGELPASPALLQAGAAGDAAHGRVRAGDGLRSRRRRRDRRLGPPLPSADRGGR